MKVNKDPHAKFGTWCIITGVHMTSPRVVTGEKNSPTVAYACRTRRLKWVLPMLRVGAQG
jgi:hypothetical protein